MDHMMKSGKQPCSKVMVIPLLLLSSEDNLRMNCSPVLSVCLSNVYGQGLHRKLWSRFLQVNRRSLSLPALPGIIIVVVLDSGSALAKFSIFSVRKRRGEICRFSKESILALVKHMVGVPKLS